MNNLNKRILLAGLAAGWLGTANAQVTTATNPRPTVPAELRDPSSPDTNPELRFNFRGVPLEMVLNYLSDAAGFIIVLETEVDGKVDAWSNQPLSTAEAVSLLNSVLKKSGKAAVRSGRTLIITTLEDAVKRDIPVNAGNDPLQIPKSDNMVTQIIPVRYATATQMTKDLEPLLGEYAKLTANESGNSLVLTDTQANVRRMVEIVKALDTSISSISTIRVFALRYADATELADAVKELFEAPTTRRSDSDRRAEFFSRFRGGRGGDSSSGSSRSRGSGSSTARTAASRVVAVADERSNSLVVSAPDEFIPTIEQLVAEIDVSAADPTELRVFHLVNSDPVEMAEVLSQLFPDENQDNESRRSGFRFGRSSFGGFGGGSRDQQSEGSERAKLKGRVVAVPDPRTESIIVSASTELMPQIAQMIAQLDSSPAKKQRVYVYSLKNADVQQTTEILRGMFERSNTQGNRNQAGNQNSVLNSRSAANQQTTPGAVGFGAQGGNTTRGSGQTFR